MLTDSCVDPEIEAYLAAITSAEPLLQSQIRDQSDAEGLPTRMLIGPVEGQFLRLLVTLSQAKRGLEIGTFLGYSALYLASALPDDGQLMTCEIDPLIAQKAQENIRNSPYADKITVVQGDAFETVPALEGHFDFIFLDAHQAQYPKYYEICVEKLRSGGWLAVDNALWKKEVLNPGDSKNRYGLAIDTFNRKAREDARLETVLLPLRDGLLLIRKI